MRLTMERNVGEGGYERQLGKGKGDEVLQYVLLALGAQSELPAPTPILSRAPCIRTGARADGVNWLTVQCVPCLVAIGSFY